MTLIIFSLLLLLSFYLLARVCDRYFIGALDKISKKLKMSSDVAGATLMAVGSSAPELFVAIIALLKPGDHVAMGVGTIVGSAIFNILVIIGVSAVVRKAVLSWQPVIRDTMFYSLSIVMLIFVFRDGHISLYEALLFVIMYVVYIIAVMNWRKILPYKDIDIIEELQERHENEEIACKDGKGDYCGIKRIIQPFDWLLSKFFLSEKNFYWNFFVSIIIIAGLSWVLVDSAIIIAEILHIPEVLIALTILAIGTSVPDLISSVIVAKQGRGGMAISNAIGSNIFDILFGLGFPWLILILITKENIAVSPENLMSSVILLFATVLVIFFLLLSKRWKIGRHSGYFLIFLYLIYLGWSIIRAYS